VRRAADAVLVLLFLAGLWIPLLGVHLGRHGWDISTARAENRRMAAMPLALRLKEAHVTLPKAKLKAFAKLPGDFKYYLSDHFGFRSLLIRAHGLLMVKGLGVTSNPAVILGKQGWLYLGNDGSTEDWRNLEPFTSQELEQFRQMLESRNAFCVRIGIPYLFVVAPSKYDIYPEYMPDNLTRVRSECRLDQLLAYLREKHSPVQVLDLRGPLMEAKKQGVRLFQKTDTHWNERGAWVAYQAIMDAVRQKLPQVEVLPLSDFDLVTRQVPGMDLAGLLGLNDVLHEESLDLVPRIPLRLPYVEQNVVEPINVPPRSAGQASIVMFRDSFMTAVLPYVAESFGRGVYFWEDGFDQNVVQTERPSIVIQEIAQRKLMHDVPFLEKTQAVKRVNGSWQLVNPP